jgi:DNA-binding transcriptional ArsR family regulator
VDRSKTADRSLNLPVADYEADDVLVVDEPEQLRALGDELRMRVVTMLRERAASTTELADTLGMPKGTVSHHLKVLERAGLVRVVRTRQVRAVTERFYGRTARLFVIKSRDELPDTPGTSAVAAAGLRQAADEVAASAADPDSSTFAGVRMRLAPEDVSRFARRLDRLVDDFRAAETPEGELYGLSVALYRPDPSLLRVTAPKQGDE